MIRYSATVWLPSVGLAPVCEKPEPSILPFVPCHSAFSRARRSSLFVCDVGGVGRLSPASASAVKDNREIFQWLFDGAINWSDPLWLWRLSPVCAAGSSRGGSLRPAEDNRLPDQTIHVRLPLREPMKSQFCHPLAVSLWARVFLRQVRACRFIVVPPSRCFLLGSHRFA